MRDSSSASLRDLRRRVARILRRAEENPERATSFLHTQVTDLLTDLRHLADQDPQLVLEIHLHLLERLSVGISEADDPTGLAADLFPCLLEHVEALLVMDAHDKKVHTDHADAVQRLFHLWFDDAEGWFAGMESLLLRVSTSPAGEHALRQEIQRALGALPLVFPARHTSGEEFSSFVLQAERHRLEHLQGELLGRGGAWEYAALVAHEHYRRTGEAYDYLRALMHLKQTEEAILLARKTLASPRVFQRMKIQELLDELLSRSSELEDRESRKVLEHAFLSRPSRRTYDKLKAVIPQDQWPARRKKILAHVHKHQKAPTLLFEIYLEDGDVLDADGLAVVQQVEVDALLKGAASVGESHPQQAAGWMLLAAYRRARAPRGSGYAEAVRILTKMKALCTKADQMDAYRSAMDDFIAAHLESKALLKRLERASLIS